MENNIENNKNYSTSSISLGINIGASKTLYSTCGIIEGRFKTHVLLSDVSKRVFPSQICYSDSHRLYGDTASALMKKFKDSSYFNLSRLIGFDDSVQFYQEELNNFFSYGFYNRESKKFKGCPTLNEEITSTNIIADYLSLINQFFFEKQINKEENVSYDYTTISVPDYFTEDHKQELKLICEAIGMKDVRIINESSAITMYYGYNKYNDFFMKNKQIQENVEKHVIFIDIGHSKTIFVYSTFNSKEFKVKKVKSLPNLGGRNFDMEIIKECLKNYPEEIQQQITYKSKIRLLETVEAARKKLTVNKEISIVVESFYKDEDLEYYLTKENFEKIIKNELDIIENSFIEFSCEIYKEFFPNNLIIEMAGEIMRTPILQEIIESVWNKQIPISKGILIDECTSVGASLYGYFMNVRQLLSIKTFKKIYEYNNYEVINLVNNEYKTKKYIRKCDCNDNLPEITLNIENTNEILLDYSYKSDQIKNISKKCLISRNKINIVKRREEYINALIVKHYVKENQIIYNLYSAYIYQNNNKFEIENEKSFPKENIELVDGIFLNEEKKKTKKDEITKLYKSHKQFDSIHYDYSIKRNKLTKLIYKYKDVIQKKN